MPVSSVHISYACAHPQWKRVRDCLAGLDAMRAGGYIPKLHKQSDEEYRAYRDRAYFCGAPSRAHEAMVGVLTKKPYTLESPIDPAVLENVDLRGSSFPAFVRSILAETSSVGRAGTLIDWNDALSRPYAVNYRAEEIINWREEFTDGNPRLTLLVLRTCQHVAGTDGFDGQEQESYTVYRTTPEGVAVEEWNVGGEQIKTSTPTRHGTPLQEIPWAWHTAEVTVGCLAPKPPLLDLCDVAISHYMTSADLENGRHTCGIPTPYAIGFGTSDLYLGSAHAWVSDNESARAGFIEFTGAGLAALADGIKEKDTRMAALGSRLLESQSKSAEAFETINLRNSAESACLSRVVLQCNGSIREVLLWLEWWSGTAETPQDGQSIFEISGDFAMQSISPEMLNALTQTYLARGMSFEAYFDVLKRGGLHGHEVTGEDEFARIQDAPPPGALPPEPEPEPAA